MDDLAHEIPLNHRKRKADGDEGPDPSASDSVVSAETMLVDSASLAPTGPSDAPRQPWLASDSAHGVWSASTAPQVSSPLSSQVAFAYRANPAKRPRLEKIETSLRTSLRSSIRSPRRSSGKVFPSRPPPTARLGNDIEDIGIVSTADPGPSSGSLLHLRGSPFATKSTDKISTPLIPVDPNSLHIPSLQPLINRQTLKELDLDAILRNPQLRHDLLFDPGLQFRPTCNRRKREISEKYWTALVRELEIGCTCVSFDLRGKPHPIVCACGQVSIPSIHPVVAFSPSLRVLTLRMPSRIRTLLSEFLEVLLLVIQPLSSISGMYVNPNTFTSQMQEHSAQAAYMRSVFDPALIEQELKHELFDPSALFRCIGVTLKGHCAPMRDRAVEVMVQAAQTCGPGGAGSKADAVKTVRMCMDILELMKLDIANHQLQTLRPFLIRTSGQFELRTFNSRQGGHCSLQITREWLCTAHRSMFTCDYPIPHPLCPGSLKYRALQRNQQIYLATLKGLTDLVFHPPLPVPCTTLPIPTTPLSQAALPTISPLSGYPETSYLDNARLLLLSTDAADTTALYMFLLLYRQLVFSESSEPNIRQDAPKVDDSELLKLKKEIRDIGSSRLGYCFALGCPPDSVNCSRTEKLEGEEFDKWHSVKQDVVLQIAMRAKEARTRPSFSSPLPSPLRQAPDERILNLAERWADSNIQPSSPLSIMLRNRLRDVVFNAVVTLAYPGRDSTGKLSNIDFSAFGRSNPTIDYPLGAATGMEPLAEEIRSLSERLSRLALIHLNAYLPLYEQDNFLGS